MMQDYPRIVSQLNLLLSAGMSTKSAWKKIIDEYKKKKIKGKKRYAYEEMEAAGMKCAAEYRKESVTSSLEAGAGCRHI